MFRNQHQLEWFVLCDLPCSQQAILLELADSTLTWGSDVQSMARRLLVGRDNQSCLLVVGLRGAELYVPWL
jgi:hypothetical protein